MRVIRERPPLFDEIDAAFKVRGKPILFAWGDVVYAPGGTDFPPHLEAHETVHGIRQGIYPGGVEAWWRRYIADADFRLEEEKPAHGAELLKRIEMDGGGRNARRVALKVVAQRMCQPLYRYRWTKAEALEFLENGNF